MTSDLERRYRFLLRAYAAAWRSSNADTVIATLQDASAPGQVWPSVREARHLVVNGWRTRVRCSAVDQTDLVQSGGIQEAVLSYEGLPSSEIHSALERFYRAYYLRPRPILRIVRDMLRDRDVMRRRLREAREFFAFMAQRRQPSPT